MAKGTRRTIRINYEGSGDHDSQCLFPPAELVALVAAGVLPRRVPVLDVGCGRGVEAVFLARMGWEVFAVDSNDDAEDHVARLAAKNKVSVHYSQFDIAEGWAGLSQRWPRRFGLVLDRMLINNFDVGEDHEARRIYFSLLADVVAPDGLLVVRDRLPNDLAEATVRRLLFSAVEPKDFFDDSEAERYFEVVENGLIVNIRLVGDDTSDPNRLDAMVPIGGQLAVLRRKREHLRQSRQANRKRAAGHAA